MGPPDELKAAKHAGKDYESLDAWPPDELKAAKHAGQLHDQDNTESIKSPCQPNQCRTSWAATVHSPT